MTPLRGARTFGSLLGAIAGAVSVCAPLATKPVLAKPATKPAPPSKTQPHAPVTPHVVPVGALAMPASIARIKLTVAGNALVVAHDVSLPRGDWKGDALDFFVAFGAPGPPRAVDAHVLPVADGWLEADDTALGDPLTTDRAPRRPLSAYALLGRDNMAGVVVHVGQTALSSALGPGNMAALRVRTVVDLGEPDETGARSAVVRLGASQGTPLKLGRIVATAQAGARGAVTRAEARLCGADADPRPLAVGIVPRPVAAAPVSPSPIAPILATRHASDDLCVRIWTAR